ncbi:hypothetical protein [Amorphus sp. 3PC139-8]|uniref:hypothetical protein n=1 Tax=Amorphus sp. 3PC139-8 TaxID=2735676 RepID=UPI00345CCA9C
MGALVSARPRGRTARHLTAIVAVLLLAGCGTADLSGVVNFPGTPGSATAPVSKQDVTFAFEPFTGMPGNIADTLAQQIADEAAIHNLQLVKRVGAPATYRVKGFLSAVSSDNAANIVYVFDVFTAEGTRLHRITGHESAGITSGDPWSGVNEDALNNIAIDVVGELDAWLGGGAK